MLLGIAMLWSSNKETKPCTDSLDRANPNYNARRYYFDNSDKSATSSRGENLKVQGADQQAFVRVAVQDVKIHWEECEQN